jgi:hypothetical protein
MEAIWDIPDEILVREAVDAHLAVPAVRAGLALRLRAGPLPAPLRGTAKAMEEVEEV